MNKIVKTIIIVVSAILILGVGLLLWLSVTDFKPADVEELTAIDRSNKDLESTFTIFNWNIGYSGLGEKSDFFFDGGESIITPENDYQTYLKGIMNTVSNSEADIYFFQEVDTNSKRSYGVNQYDKLAENLVGFSSLFAFNYKVAYIPPPALFKTSYGRINAGLATFSKYKIEQGERLSLPGNYSWPRSILFLDRCMMVTELVTEDNRNVVLINTHNSAYDKGGFIKEEQLIFIKQFALKEYNAGKYVIIGGDWNSYMPGTTGETFPAVEKASIYNQGLPSGWQIEGWNWGTDSTVPTSRSLATTYKKGENFECVIDGFLLSPNIEIKHVQNHDLGFKYSDHNPIEMTVRLK